MRGAPQGPIKSPRLGANDSLRAAYSNFSPFGGSLLRPDGVVIRVCGLRGGFRGSRRGSRMRRIRRVIRLLGTLK